VSGYEFQPSQSGKRYRPIVKIISDTKEFLEEYSFEATLGSTMDKNPQTISTWNIKRKTKCQTFNMVNQYSQFHAMEISSESKD
jgi:hypothetical protein